MNRGPSGYFASRALVRDPVASAPAGQANALGEPPPDLLLQLRSRWGAFFSTAPLVCHDPDKVCRGVRLRLRCIRGVCVRSMVITVWSYDRCPSWNRKKAEVGGKTGPSSGSRETWCFVLQNSTAWRRMNAWYEHQVSASWPGAAPLARGGGGVKTQQLIRLMVNVYEKTT